MLLEINLANLIAFSIAMAVIAFLVFQLFIMRRAELNLMSQVKQQEMDLDEMKSKLQNYYNNASAFATADKDFMKFLNDSRDSAFAYIEQAQGSFIEIADNTAQISALLDEASRLRVEKQLNNINSIIDNLLPNSSSAS